MKKTIIVTFIAVITVIAGYNIYTSQTNENLSSLMLANIEALASGEGGGQQLKCYKTISSAGSGLLTHVTYCATCSATLANSYSNSWYCN